MPTDNTFVPTAVERAEINNRAQQAMRRAVATLLDLAPADLSVVVSEAAACVLGTYQTDGFSAAGRHADDVALATLRRYLGNRQVVVIDSAADLSLLRDCVAAAMDDGPARAAQLYGLVRSLGIELNADRPGFRCPHCGGSDPAACDPCVSDPAWQGPR